MIENHLKITYKSSMRAAAAILTLFLILFSLNGWSHQEAEELARLRTWDFFLKDCEQMITKIESMGSKFEYLNIGGPYEDNMELTAYFVEHAAYFVEFFKGRIRDPAIAVQRAKTWENNARRIRLAITKLLERGFYLSRKRESFIEEWKQFLKSNEQLAVDIQKIITSN